MKKIDNIIIFYNNNFIIIIFLTINHLKKFVILTALKLPDLFEIDGHKEGVHPNQYTFSGFWKGEGEKWLLGNGEHYSRHSNHWIVHPFLALCGHTQCLHFYILHCDISALSREKIMSHKDFQAELVCQLCHMNNSNIPSTATLRTLLLHCHQVDK